MLTEYLCYRWSACLITVIKQQQMHCCPWFWIFMHMWHQIHFLNPSSLFLFLAPKNKTKQKMLPPIVISAVMFLHLFQGYCLVIWFDYWSVWWCLTLKSKWEWSQMRFNKQKKSGSWSCSHCCDNWYFCLFESLNAKINSTFWLLRGIHYKDSWQWI